jgi:hypothetical protein
MCQAVCHVPLFPTRAKQEPGEFLVQCAECVTATGVQQACYAELRGLSRGSSFNSSPGVRDPSETLGTAWINGLETCSHRNPSLHDQQISLVVNELMSLIGGEYLQASAWN